MVVCKDHHLASEGGFLPTMLPELEGSPGPRPRQNRTGTGSSSLRCCTCAALATLAALTALVASASEASARQTVPSAVGLSTADDTLPPSAPAGLVARGSTTTAISLSWRRSTDNFVKGYGVYSQGTRVGRPSKPSFVVGRLACGKSYRVAVDAFDAARNRSTRRLIRASTLPCSSSPPPSSGPAPPKPPRAPVTDKSNPQGLGFNVYSGQADIHDKRIQDTGDSAILLHGTESNGVVRRVEIGRVQQVVGWATHGIYAKAPGGLFEDIRIDNTGGVASSGITLRMRNQTLRRIWIGGGFQHPLTYYEHDGQGGLVLVEDAELHCTNGQTCIWGDDSNGPPSPGLKQQFIFRRVHVFGPAGMKFLNFMNYTGPGIEIESSFINGRPVTAADVGSGIPASKVTIRP